MKKHIQSKIDKDMHMNHQKNAETYSNQETQRDYKIKICIAIAKKKKRNLLSKDENKPLKK